MTEPHLMDHFQNELIEIQNEVIKLLAEMKYSRVFENGKCFTSLLPSERQIGEIQFIVNKYNNLSSELFNFLSNNLSRKYEFNLISHNIDSYLKFSRVSGDFHEDTWKKLYEQEFRTIVTALLNFLKSLSKNTDKCFRLDIVCSVSNAPVDGKNIFVLIPSSEKYADVYNLGIKESLKNSGYSVLRSKEIKGTGDIVCNYICKPIKKASIILAEISDLNPNVMLELGIAYGLNKKVILLAIDYDSIPFNLKKHAYCCIWWEY